MCHRPCSSIGFRALVYGTRGCGFEPRQGHCGMPGEPPASRSAAIAQTAERTPRKRQVAGSCPARGSNGSRAPSGAGPSLPLAPSRTASLSLTAGPTFAGMGHAIRFLRGRRPAAGRLVRNEEVAGSNPVGSTTRNASKSEHNHTGVSPTRETHKLTADPLPAVRVEGEGTPPWPGEGGHAVPVRIRVGARRRIGGTLILRGSSQNVRASPGVPARRNTGMDGGPCGKGAVLLRLLGAEVPGEFDSRTIRLPICSDRPRDRAWNPVSKTGWIGMAECSRAYVSDAFAHIPPWCNGSTRVFGTHSPGSKPGGGA